MHMNILPHTQASLRVMNFKVNLSAMGYSEKFSWKCLQTLQKKCFYIAYVVM